MLVVIEGRKWSLHDRIVAGGTLCEHVAYCFRGRLPVDLPNNCPGSGSLFGFLALCGDLVRVRELVVLHDNLMEVTDCCLFAGPLFAPGVRATTGNFCGFLV